MKEAWPREEKGGTVPEVAKSVDELTALSANAEEFKAQGRGHKEPARWRRCANLSLPAPGPNGEPSRDNTMRGPAVGSSLVAPR
jgi:hypothetical protein